MPDTRTTYDAVLKDVYLPQIARTMNEEVTLFKIANAKDERVGGRRLIFPVHVNRNWGVGSRAESATLPTAGNEVYLTATVTPRFWYGRVRLTGPLMATAVGDRNAFANALGEIMDGMVRNGKRYFNKSLVIGQRGDLMRFDDGRATASTSTFTITSTIASGVFPRGNPARWLAEGMMLDGLNLSGALTETTAVSTDFTSTTLTSVTISASGTTAVTFSATVTVVSGTILVHTGTQFRDYLGLDDGIDATSTYLGVVRTAFRNRGFRGTVLGNAGTLRSLSLDLMQEAWDEVAEAAGEDATITNMLAHSSVRRQYIQLLQQDVRFQPMELRGGTRELTFNGAEFKFEVDMPYHNVYGLNGPSWHLFKVRDFEWIDDDGAVLSRVADTDAFEATLRCYGNFASTEPRKNFRIADVQATL